MKKCILGIFVCSFAVYANQLSYLEQREKVSAQLKSDSQNDNLKLELARTYLDEAKDKSDSKALETASKINDNVSDNEKEKAMKLREEIKVQEAALELAKQIQQVASAEEFKEIQSASGIRYRDEKGYQRPRVQTGRSIKVSHAGDPRVQVGNDPSLHRGVKTLYGRKPSRSTRRR